MLPTADRFNLRHSLLTKALFNFCLRILPDLSAFCRVKSFISFVFNRLRLTLDQHIGVRIPGGQPNLSITYKQIASWWAFSHLLNLLGFFEVC